MDFSLPQQLLSSLLTRLPAVFVGTNYAKYFQYWPIFLIGFIFALLLTPILGQIATKYDLTYKAHQKRKGKEHDNAEKAMHDGTIPGLGGIAVMLPVLLAMLFFFKLDAFTIPVIIGFSVLFLGSILDDIFNLPAKVQLGYQLLASTIIAFSIIDLTSISFIPEAMQSLDSLTWEFSILGIQQSFAFPGDFFLILWLVLSLNAFKWIGGSPGIIESNSLVIYVLIFIIAIRYGSIFAATTSMIVIGALFAFLIFALPPPKIFSGSSGRTVYGFLICILALIADAKMATTIILLILPLIDFTYVVIKRYLTHRPKNPLDILRINDTTHLHHQFLKMGYTRTQVVLIETSMTLLLSSIAVLTTGAMRFFAIIICVLVGILFVLGVNLAYAKREKQKTENQSPESKYSY